MKATVLAQEKAFKVRSKKGTFTPLYEFADDRRLKFADEAELVSMITARYPGYITSHCKPSYSHTPRLVATGAPPPSRQWTVEELNASHDREV